MIVTLFSLIQKKQISNFKNNMINNAHAAEKFLKIANKLNYVRFSKHPRANKCKKLFVLYILFFRYILVKILIISQILF